MRIIIVLLILLLPALASAQQMVVDSSGSRPVPDPTVLTTQALKESIATTRELFEHKVAALGQELAQVKATLDRTDERLIKRLDALPEQAAIPLIALQRLMEEKFKGVDQQFQGRDVALAAALLAQKTSVDEQNKANAASSAKQEGAITKQIDGIQAIISANSNGTDGKIDSVKALLVSQAKSIDDKIVELRSTISDLRAAQVAITARGSGQSDLWVYVVMGVTVIIALAGLFIRFNRDYAGDRNGNANYHPPSYYPPNYAPPNYPPPPSYPPPNVSVVPVVPVPIPPSK